MSRVTKKEWFNFYIGWYRTESRIQKRYINRLFNKIDKEIICKPVNGSSNKLLSLEEFIFEINSDANKQSKIRKYCFEKFAEYLI